MGKIVNVYIVYDLDVWPRNLSNHFKFKNCLFETTNIIKNNNTEKYVYKGYRVTCDDASDFPRNVVNFGFDNSSSSHSANCKNNFLIIGDCLWLLVLWKLWDKN